LGVRGDITERGAYLRHRFARRPGYRDAAFTMPRTGPHYGAGRFASIPFVQTSNSLPHRPLAPAPQDTAITPLAREIVLRIARLASHLPGFLYQYRMRPDGTSHFPFATAGIADIYGCRPEDVADDATPVMAALHPEDAERVMQAILESRDHLAPWRDRYRVLHATRGVIWVEGDAGPEREPDGSTVWHGYIKDVSAENAREEQLRLLGTVFSSSQQCVLITDREHRIVEVNDSYVRSSGYSRDELLGRNPAMFSRGLHSPAFFAGLWREFQERGHWSGEIRNRRRDGSLMAGLMSLDAVRDPTGALTHHVAILSDISHIKEHQRELERIANFDVLTGLPNRRLLADRIEVSIQHAQRSGRSLAVCFLDLDGFKGINDTHGHGAGDDLLKRVAERLCDAVRGSDTVARVGGDEFVLLLTDFDARAQIVEVLERVLAAVAGTQGFDGMGAAVSASIGVAVFPDFRHAEELLRSSDQAMYRAKQQGGNCFLFSEAAENDAMLSRQALLREVAGGLERGEFELFFQPKIELHSREVSSAEALLRWRQPDGSYRAPGTFIPALAGHPLELAVGRWVLDSALAVLEALLSRGIRLSLSVNIAVDHLLHDSFIPQLEALLAKHATPDPRLLVLEILETSRIPDFQRVRDRLTEIKCIGVVLALDDFGTGYSSMTHLRQLPVDKVKIDQSFVLGMLDNEEDENIVEGIIGLAHAFDRQVIAEGAETLEHLERLRDLGCDLAQGYAIARPMPAHELPEWLRSWRWRQVEMPDGDPAAA
jgi:diguanylate cyclase (GGDEF)-like protein/PAS domain S-box-containing protein